MEKHTSPPPSPLDAIMVGFLGYVRSQNTGYLGGAQARDAAEHLDVPEALVEAIFTSARQRGLMGPDFNARGRTRWIVSDRGLTFLERHAAASPSPDS